jgi:hypothetical protein
VFCFSYNNEFLLKQDDLIQNIKLVWKIGKLNEKIMGEKTNQHFALAFHNDELNSIQTFHFYEDVLIDQKQMAK